jgi:hypothetical protein
MGVLMVKVLSCVCALGLQRLVLRLPLSARLWVCRGSVRSCACSDTFSIVLPLPGFKKKASSSIRR